MGKFAVLDRIGVHHVDVDAVDAFTFTDTAETEDSGGSGITITAVTPSKGIVGSSITITGTNFPASPTVSLGGAAVTDAVRVNATTITGTVPAGIDTGTLLEVTVNGISSSPVFTPLLFSSLWNTATGAGESALTDGGKWDDAEINNNITVIAATGLGFPASMTNVLRFHLEQPSPTSCAVAVGPAFGTNNPGPAQWSNPGAGESRFFRFPFRWDADFDPRSDWCHPWETTLTESEALHVNWKPLSDTTWAFAWRPSTSIAFPVGIWTYGGSRNSPGALTKGTVYIFEAQVLRLSTSGGSNGTGTFNFHARILNADGTTFATDSSFFSQNGSSTLASTPTLSWPTVFNLNSIVWDSSSGMGGWTPATAAEYNYGGAMAVGAADWCGVPEAGEDG